jgi:dATP pyrophosphohydrolase
MTDVRVSLVDVYVVRPAPAGAFEILALQRSTAGRCAGSWETVHGHIEGDESPVLAALRELREETGLVPQRLFNISRVEAFYRHAIDEVALIPVFAAMVPADATVTLSAEHAAHEWLTAREVVTRLAWPRERRAVPDVLALIDPEAAGVHDVLVVDPSLWTGEAPG